MHRHKWSKWKQYSQSCYNTIYGVIQRDCWGNSEKYYELREKRYCEICNKMQDRKVRRK